ncbi:MAG: hypothetical protein WCG87_06470 [Bacteroidota bacterium]
MFLTIRDIIRKQPELILIPLFLVIYAFCLTFQYVEGDDAYSVFFHALGRNKNIEGPYSPYQGMMDWVLWLLPANETIVRIVAISIHAVFGIIFPIVTIKLGKTFEIFKESKNNTILFFVFLIPFINPEYIFFGIYYQCSTIALSLILIAHMMLKSAYLKEKKLTSIIFAAIVFGIGVCFRWDTGLYLFVIMIDLYMVYTDNLKRKDKIISGIGKVILTATLSGLGVLLFVYAEGYGINDILFRIAFAKEFVEHEHHVISWMINIGSSLSVFTPFVVLFFLIGCFVLVKRKKPLLLILFIVAYVPVLKFYPTEILNPRRIINAIPMLMMICYVGFNYMFVLLASYKSTAYVLGTIIAFIPWIIGVQVNTDNTMWGPGFDVKRHEIHKKKAGKTLEDIDKRIQIKDVKFVFLGDGFAVPFEGPRPIWGYYDVIFGGKWRKLLNYMNDERDAMLAVVKKEHIPILQQDFGVNMSINLLRDGYTTLEKKGGKQIDSNVFIRRFFKGTDTVTFMYPLTYFHLSIIDSAYIHRCMKAIHSPTLGLYVYSTSILMEMKNSYPDKVVIFGPATGEIKF